jgi:hypothetical protein
MSIRIEIPAKAWESFFININELPDIRYWCNSLSVKSFTKQGLTDVDEFTEKVFESNFLITVGYYDDNDEAVERIASTSDMETRLTRAFTANPNFLITFARWIAEEDDSNDRDVLFQLMVFGEVRFG